METNEERLFQLIEEINVKFKSIMISLFFIQIPYLEYEKYLENQKMAQINAQIHQTLLFT